MTAIRRPAMLVAAVAILALRPLDAGQPEGGSLARALEAQLARFPAHTGVYVKHLSSGQEAAVRADDAFNSQSVIKLPILVRAFQLADAGTLRLDERVQLTRADLRDGTGVLQYHDVGLAPTVRDLLLDMVITSDNTATDIMTTKVGGVAALNEWLAASGYRMRMVNRGYEYRRKLLARLDPRLADITAEETTGLQYAASDNPLFERYRPLFVGERARWVEIVRDPEIRRRRAADQRRLMVEDRTIWLGDMSPREAGRMLEGIESGTAASKAACDTMRTFLRRQLAGSRRLPHFVQVPVGHKTGDAGNIANDVGILYAHTGPIVVAFFSNGITGSYGEAEDRIGRLAELVVDYFDGR